MTSVTIHQLAERLRPCEIATGAGLLVHGAVHAHHASASPSDATHLQARSAPPHVMLEHLTLISGFALAKLQPLENELTSHGPAHGRPPGPPGQATCMQLPRVSMPKVEKNSCICGRQCAMLAC